MNRIFPLGTRWLNPDAGERLAVGGVRKDILHMQHAVVLLAPHVAVDDAGSSFNRPIEIVLLLRFVGPEVAIVTAEDFLQAWRF